jgi:hypothetical protein
VFGELKQGQEGLVNPLHLGQGTFLWLPFELVGEKLSEKHLTTPRI